ncbi:hypothetical protein SGRIM128S_03193 [Streptomyces griseomycini]
MTAWQRSVPVVDGRIADVRVHFDVLLDDDLLDRAAARGTLTSVRARLTGELRGQPAQWLAGALRRWRRDERRARHHPDCATSSCTRLWTRAWPGRAPTRWWKRSGTPNRRPRWWPPPSARRYRTGAWT